jgi:hypothetical protein
MDGRKLGFGLGVLVVVAALGVVALIDHSKAPSKSDGKELEATSAADSTGKRPSTTAQMQKSFGGLTYARAGGIAGFSDLLKIDPDMSVSVTSHGETHQDTLSSGDARTLLTSLDELAAHASKPPRAESANHPDAMSEDTSFVWDGDIHTVDPALRAAAPVTDLIDSLLKPTAGR